MNNVYHGLYGGDKKGLYSGMGAAPGGGRRNPMIYGKQPSRWPRIVLAVVMALIIILCIRQFACGGILPQGNEEEQAQQEQAQSESGESSSDASAQTASEDLTKPGLNGTYQAGLDATVQISAIGDCTLGTDENFDDSTSFTKLYDETGTPAYFFTNVRRFLDADQLTICNFEGTLSSRGEREDKEFAFRAPAKYAKILTEGGVEAANLANNHSYDYGSDSYEDTKKALSDNKIANFGYDRVATYEANGIKIGLFGINALSGYEDAAEMTKQNIKALQDQGCALIVGDFHWGEEGEYDANAEQGQLAHEAVDAGCDLVIGGHSHVLQGVEVYNDRYIAYSLGNFCFGGNDNPMDYNTMIFQQTFTFKDGQLLLDDTTKKAVDIVPCSVSSSTSVNNYQPTPLSKKKVPGMVKKLNETSEKLSGTSVKFATELNEYDCAVAQ